MKVFETKQRQLGDILFYVRPLPAFTAANISGEVIGAILPALLAIGPMLGDKDDPTALLDIDSEVAAKALAKGASGFSGDKIESLLKRLLVQHKNISFETVNEKKSKLQILTEDLANDLFCGDVQDMFILAFDVIKSNYSSFFEKLANLFGDRIGAFQNLVKTGTAGLKNMEN